jgi:hypothetical protein
MGGWVRNSCSNSSRCSLMSRELPHRANNDPSKLELEFAAQRGYVHIASQIFDRITNLSRDCRCKIRRRGGLPSHRTPRLRAVKGEKSCAQNKHAILTTLAFSLKFCHTATTQEDLLGNAVSDSFKRWSSKSANSPTFR